MALTNRTSYCQTNYTYTTRENEYGSDPTAFSDITWAKQDCYVAKDVVSIWFIYFLIACISAFIVFKFVKKQE